MTFDLQKILASKRAYRQALAAKPIAEKLQMLDALRERALTIRAVTKPNVLRESPGKYRTPRP